MSSGCFITLEGIEGAGKSTLGRHLADWLGRRGITARLTREPGGTPLAEKVRELVLQPGGEAVPPTAEMLLMFAARSIHLANLVRPALARGEWVICDRFTDATRAYQGGGRGQGAGLIEQLATLVHPDLTPHCTLLLDLPVALGLSRARQRSGAHDRFEQERAPFFERVRSAYLELARQEPARFRLIDASQPLETVQAQARASIEALYAAAAGAAARSS